jgi:hypothetical protein
MPLRSAVVPALLGLWLHLPQCDSWIVQLGFLPQRHARSGAAALMRAAALAPESQEEFEKRCKQFAPAAELAGIRQECLTAEHQMDAAVDREDYVAAAMYRDDLRELQAKDPAEAARQMREQMDLAVKREDYDAACMYRGAYISLFFNSYSHK